MKYLNISCKWITEKKSSRVKLLHWVKTAAHFWAGLKAQQGWVTPSGGAELVMSREKQGKKISGGEGCDSLRRHHTSDPWHHLTLGLRKPFPMRDTQAAPRGASVKRLPRSQVHTGAAYEWLLPTESRALNKGPWWSVRDLEISQERQAEEKVETDYFQLRCTK